MPCKFGYSSKPKTNKLINVTAYIYFALQNRTPNMSWLIDRMWVKGRSCVNNFLKNCRSIPLREAGTEPEASDMLMR